MSEKKILGVCSWVSEKFDLDVSGIRMFTYFNLFNLISGKAKKHII